MDRAWSARVEWPARDPSDEALMAIAETVDEHHSAVRSDAAAGTISVQITVTAGTLRQAVDVALTVARAAAAAADLRFTPTRLEVLPKEVFHDEVHHPRVPELVGYAEIAAMAGVSRQRARELPGLADFPPGGRRTVHRAPAGPLPGRSVAGQLVPDPRPPPPRKDRPHPWREFRRGWVGQNRAADVRRRRRPHHGHGEAVTGTPVVGHRGDRRHHRPGRPRGQCPGHLAAEHPRRCEEWFRRVQWADGLTLSEQTGTQDAGFRLLGHLAESALAKPEAKELLLLLSVDNEVEALERDDADDLDVIDFVRDTDTKDTEEPR